MKLSSGSGVAQSFHHAGNGRFVDHPQRIVARPRRNAGQSIIARTDGPHLWQETRSLRNPSAAEGRGYPRGIHARDTRLDRKVAVKTLPEFIAHDADRLQRFVLCALDNSNLLFILDVGLAGVHYLVSESPEGNVG